MGESWGCLEYAHAARNSQAARRCTHSPAAIPDADSLSLPPGEAFCLPASRRSTMARGIDAALEPFGDVVGVWETLCLRCLRRGEAALAAAADEVDAVLRGEACLPQLVSKGGIMRHGRIDLPLDRHHLLARRRQVRQTDEIPLRVGPD